MVKYYYQISNIFAFTSTSETFGLVIIEALASGLPVLAIKAPGVVDIVTDGVDGMLVDDDIYQFADYLTKLIINKKLRQKLSEGALSTAGDYNIDKISDQMLTLYQKLIADNREKNFSYNPFES